LDVADLTVETHGAIPVDPVDGAELCSVPCSLRSMFANHFGFVGPVERLSHGIVTEIIDLSDRRNDAD
jgi:hypothetical protein